MYCTIQIAKTKALISFAVTAKLVWVFVFAYAKRWFSHARAHFICRFQFHCGKCQPVRTIFLWISVHYLYAFPHVF